MKKFHGRSETLRILKRMMILKNANNESL